MQYSYRMHIRQPNVMLSYWVIQAQHTHASNLNTLRESREIKQNKTRVHLKGNRQWPCSSFWVDLEHRRGFHSAMCGSILQIFNGLLPLGLSASQALSTYNDIIFRAADQVVGIIRTMVRDHIKGACFAIPASPSTTLG